MALTAAEVKNARSGERDYKLGDEKGLYLLVTAKGSKSWRLKYRFGGKERRLTFGLYPEVTLVEARARRDRARELLRDNKDPALEALRLKTEAVAASEAKFETVAREWHEDEKARWSPGQAKLVLRALERDIFPELGALPVSYITGPMILRELRKIERRGAIETAKRVKGYVSAVFRRAEGEHLVDSNPADKIGRALKPTPIGSKQPAITDAAALIQLQKAIDASTSSPVTKLASRLLALTGVRVGVLRAATWDEFDGIDWSDPDADAPAAIWRISAERMKLAVEEKGEDAYDHDVPLVPEAVKVLRALRPLTGRIALLFPGQRSTKVAMSDSALSTLYKRRGYRGAMVPHGWRAAFSTIMNEWAIEHGRDSDRAIVDLMLAHVPRGTSASEYAYNRAKFVSRRRELAEAWAGMISEGLRPPLELLKGEVR